MYNYRKIQCFSLKPVLYKNKSTETIVEIRIYYNKEGDSHLIVN